MLDESVLREAKLCVVGNVNRDIKTAPIQPGDYLFADGETSVADISETIGGGGANSAAIAARLGAGGAFSGQVGDDETGRRLEQALTRAGVRCHLSKVPGLPTGSTVNLVFDTGQRHFLSCHPNNAALAFEALDLAPLATADHLLRADIWFSDAMLFGGNEKLFKAAGDAGVPVSIDLNWDPQWGRAPQNEIARRKEAIRGVLPLVELAHGNIRELNEFTGEGELQSSVARLLEWGVRAVVVHMGAQGAGYFSRNEFAVEPPAPVERRMMATGTGDVLSVCLMLLHHRADLAAAEKLRLANRIVAEFIEGKRALIPTL
jgi:sugar/nucleoside kinase (ribokinase family)